MGINIYTFYVMYTAFDKISPNTMGVLYIYKAISISPRLGYIKIDIFLIKVCIQCVCVC
jgi:hypothetical protein